VAAGLCYGALGTDTAGSIRLPSAYCGLTGLKPSYGLVSTRGIIPLSWSLDHVGPMARTAVDAAIMLQAIAYYDSQDVYCQRFPPVFYPSAIEESTSSLRLGLAREFWDQLDEEVRHAVDAAVTVLKSFSAEAREINLSTEADRTVVRCEPYAYHQQYLPQHEKDYDPETLKRIRSGADVTAPQYLQAYRDLLRQRREILHLFDQIDLIITPTTPNLPPSFAELEAAPGELRSRELVMLRNTRPFNMLGLPAVSLCCGFSRTGLPIGLQIAGAPGADGVALAMAHAYQKQTDWHKKRPEIAS
jgi:aspartyl-tRNA(Asn)/glutamyl-tRNA(Gln) amidotransferase subunit A